MCDDPWQNLWRPSCRPVYEAPRGMGPPGIQGPPGMSYQGLPGINGTSYTGPTGASLTGPTGPTGGRSLISVFTIPAGQSITLLGSSVTAVTWTNFFYTFEATWPAHVLTVRAKLSNGFYLDAGECTIPNGIFYFGSTYVLFPAQNLKLQLVNQSALIDTVNNVTLVPFEAVYWT